jgi:hypothetical protein
MSSRCQEVIEERRLMQKEEDIAAMEAKLKQLEDEERKLTEVRQWQWQLREKDCFLGIERLCAAGDGGRAAEEGGRGQAESERSTYHRVIR